MKRRIRFIKGTIVLLTALVYNKMLKIKYKYFVVLDNKEEIIDRLDQLADLIWKAIRTTKYYYFN